MERWSGKVVVVTGASAGVGLATVKTLVRQGMIVVGLARRKTLMEDMMKDVTGPGKFYSKECDITKEDSVIESLNWVKDNFGSLNVLINNAGAIKHTKIEDTPTSELEHIISVNLLGVLYCTKQAIKLMRENQKEAHIINVNSVLGHEVPPPIFTPFNVYPSTKFAITALSKTLQGELIDTKIRVTNLSPGLIRTGMMEAAALKNPNIVQYPALEPDDVANTVVVALAMPPHVEIKELTVEAKRM